MVVRIGVPQGFILGLFMFLTYINDLPYLAKDNHEIFLFADDTSVIYSILCDGSLASGGAGAGQAQVGALQRGCARLVPRRSARPECRGG